LILFACICLSSRASAETIAHVMDKHKRD